MARSESESSGSRSNRDMLSSLPDSLLHHIMSFMFAQEAVQLCVLSKRWKTLWTTLPFLNFEFNEFVNNQLVAFTEFVSTVILLREATSQLHTFTLHCVSYSVPADVFGAAIRPWIRDTIHKPEIINLPSLKQLYLENQEFDQDFMSKIFCGCPVLEKLYVRSRFLEFSKITSHSLKHLIIEALGHLESIELSEMIINCPNLLSFHFATCSCPLKKGTMLNMPSLHEAHIEFGLCCDELDVTKSNILSGLTNVHHLRLGGDLLQACLKAEIANCRTFSKLTCLSVRVCFNCCQFDLLSSLLEHCPNLKKLLLGPPQNSCGCEVWSKQIKVPLFKCKQLETVKVNFDVKDRTFHRMIKCLQEAVAELPNCRIIKARACNPYTD
ncbi:F-box/LRR-repeat protein [Carex littledalei]|uniref:F-box/LRR-repeat protein n=1 Tax=Carex littledalei TaxID=544730 RepID=A0A833R109_9POAL|nr:F-box/LRR-repeat protein [Carex littledalei]